MQLPERIECEDLVLRPFCEDDREAFVAFMTCSGNTGRFMFSDEQKSPSGARSLFASVINSYGSSTPYFMLAILDRASGRLIGICGLSGLPGAALVFEPFCCLAVAARGKGYATHAMEAMIDDCFARKVVNEFRVYIDSANQLSARMAHRLKFRFVIRERHPMHGDECDVYVMRASEWKKMKII